MTKQKIFFSGVVLKKIRIFCFGVCFFGFTIYWIIQCRSEFYSIEIHGYFTGNWNSWKLHPTKKQFYNHLLPIKQTTKNILGIAGRSKDELISDVLLWTSTRGHTSVGWPVKTYIFQLCIGTGYRLEDLPKVITHKDECVCVCVCVCEREREREREGGWLWL